MEPVPVAPHPKHLIHPRFWICGALLVICASANAQQNRITKPIDNAQRFTLSGHVYAKATPANDRGRVAPSLKLSYVTLTLTTSDAQKADLKNLLAEQQNPSSPNYRRWLTPDQYADRFGVSAQDMSQITQWLQSQGLSIVNVAQGRNWIAVSGSAAQIETAFTTEIHQYVVDGETHFANATNPSVPAAIGGMVLSIRGLNDFRMKPRSKAKFTSGSGSHYVAAGDIATIYDILPAYAAGIDGSGQKLVIAGQSEVPVADLQNYQSAFNLTGPLPQMVLVGSNPGVVSGDREESDIDLELSGAVARNASIILVYSNDVMDSVNYAIDQNLAPVISVSYGSCEQEAGAQPGVASGQAQALTFQSWAQRANAQGITWFDASGDDGAADCDDAQNPGLAVDTPASVPEVTAVGGTEFVEGSGTYWSATNGANGGSALSYIPETAWNDSVSFGGPDASGGGVSIFFPQPSWQAGFPGMPGNNARNVPDVALNASNAHDGYIIYTDGQDTQQVFGGTSCPTPVMAGIATLLNQYLGTSGVGNANPHLYSLAQSNPAIFHPLAVAGNNIVTAQVDCGRHGTCTTATPVGYTANAGSSYNDVTGLGSVDAWKLLTCWNGTCSATTPTAPPPTPATASLSLVSNVSSVGPQNYALLTATVTANNGVTTPVGVVQFSAGTTALGAPTLVGSAGISTATIVVEGGTLPADSTTVMATYDGSSTSAPVTSSVLLSRAVGSSSNGGPEIPSNGLLDGASFLAKFSPGMIMSVFGAALSPVGTAESAGSVPLPVTMAGVAATVNGVEAPLYYVSPTQLNIQVPWQTALGPATVTVNNNGQVASQTFNLTAASPGIFTDQNKNIVCGCSAVQGQLTTLYLAGTGAVTPTVATGSAPAASTPLASLPAPQDTTITVAGVQAATKFIGIPYGLVGVTQINFQIPSGMTGRQPVVVSVNGVLSATAYVNVTN